MTAAERTRLIVDSQDGRLQRMEGHELYEEGGILVFETWTAENARVVPNTVHKWKVKGEELEYESGVINFFVMGFRPCEEEHARDILKELV